MPMVGAVHNIMSRHWERPFRVCLGTKMVAWLPARLDGLTGFDWSGYLTHLLLIRGADIGHFQESKETSKQR